MTYTICQRPTSQQGMKGMECFKVQLTNGLGEVATVLRVGTQSGLQQMLHMTPSHISWSYGWLIDCIDSEGLSGLGPLHWMQAGSFQSVPALDNPGFFISNIIRASSLHVISGLLPAGEQVLRLTQAIFHITCWETQPCWKIKPSSDWGKGERALSSIYARTFKAHWNGYVAESRVTFKGIFQTWHNAQNKPQTLSTAHLLKTIFEMLESKVRL